MSWLVFWAIVFVVMVVLEVVTAGLYACWFAIGALVAFVVALFTDVVLVQFVVFFTVSILLIVFARPFLKRLLEEKQSQTDHKK